MWTWSFIPNIILLNSRGGGEESGSHASHFHQHCAMQGHRSFNSFAAELLRCPSIFGQGTNRMQIHGWGQSALDQRESSEGLYWMFISNGLFVKTLPHFTAWMSRGGALFLSVSPPSRFHVDACVKVSWENGKAWLPSLFLLFLFLFPFPQMQRWLGTP